MSWAIATTLTTGTVYTVGITATNAEGLSSPESDFTITIHSFPTATLSNNGPVNVSDSAAITFSNVSEPAVPGAAFVYSFASSEAGLASAVSSTTPYTTVTFPASGFYTEFGRVSDQFGSYADYSTTVAVNPVTLTAILSNNGPVNEGSPVMVTFSDPSENSIANTAAGFHYSFATTEAGLTGSYFSTSSTPTASFIFYSSGTDTIWGRIIDQDGYYTDYSTTAIVNNLPPYASGISGPANVVENSPAGTYTYSLAGVVDPFTGPNHNGSNLSNVTYSFALTQTGLAGSWAAGSGTNSFSPAIGTQAFTVYAQAYNIGGGASPIYTLFVSVEHYPVLSPTGTISMVEGGTYAATVTATDIDPNVLPTYSIVGGVDAAQFHIDASSAS